LLSQKRNPVGSDRGLPAGDGMERDSAGGNDLQRPSCPRLGVVKDSLKERSPKYQLGVWKPELEN
jgi:hypothetical protein